MQSNLIHLPTRSNDSNREPSRAEIDGGVALENGFAFGDKLWFHVGTQADQHADANGIELARRHQVEFKGKPLARDVATHLIEQVEREGRKSLPAVHLSDLRMTDDGKVAIRGSRGFTRIPVTNKAFNSMFGRFSCSSGQAYLNSCPTKLRSINFNHWAVETGEEEAGKNKVRKVVLRTRRNPIDEHRNVFAAVSPSYTVLDCDKIARSLRDALPSDARGSLDYNGERFRLEALWHTDVDPAKFQTGEIFKAGVLVKADDTGSGSIVVQAILWRHACKNLLIINKAIGFEARLRHRGGEKVLTERFEEAFQKALCSIDSFTHAWGYASAERDAKLVERVRSVTHGEVPSSARDALPGIFNGLLERELITIPGERQAVLDQLCEMHRQDELASAYGVSRASVINAVTRFAHKQIVNPFQADELREQAGALLSNHKGDEPAPLPFIAVA